mgnify:FL=1
MTLEEVTGDLPANDGVTGGARAASTTYDQVAGPAPLRRGKGKKPQAAPETLRPGPNSMYAYTDPRVVADEPSLAEQLDAQARAKYAGDQNIGMGTKFAAAWQNEVTPYVDGFVRTVRPSVDRLDVAWRDERNRNWEKHFAGYSDEEQELLMGANNKDDWEHRVERIKTKRENDAVLATSSPLAQLGYGFVAGMANPVYWPVGGMVEKGFANVGMGAYKLAQQGRKVAAGATVVAENAVGNLVTEAALDMMGEHRSLQDYGFAAMMGLLPSTIQAPAVYKHAQESLAMRLKLEGEMRKARVLQQAIDNVGKDAPDHVKIAEAQRIEREQITTVQRAATSRAREDDRIPAQNLDELPPEEPVIEAPVTKVAEPDGVSAQTDIAPTKAPESTSMDAMVKRAAQRGDEHVVGFSPELTFKGVSEAPAGVHLAGNVADSLPFQSLRTTAEWLRKEFLPDDMAITLANPIEVHANGKLLTPRGLLRPVNERSVIIAVKPGSDGTQTLVHEVAHTIEKTYLKDAPEAMRNAIYDDYARWFKEFNAPGKGLDSLLARSPLRRAEEITPDAKKSLYQHLVDTNDPLYAEYFGRFEEWFAEQGGKYFEAGARGAGPAAKLPLPQQIMQAAKDLFRRLLEMFVKADEKGLLRPNTSIEDFMEWVRTTGKEGGISDMADVASMPVAGKTVKTAEPAAPRIPEEDMAFAKKYGLDLMPQGTPRERAEFKAVMDIWKQAEKWDINNPTDEALLKSMLGNNDTFNVALPATLMASSPNQVLRMVAGVLTENATGASGRRPTAALSKYMLERSYIGRSNIEFDNAYKAWRDEVGGNMFKDHYDTRDRNAFNRAVAVEIEARRTKTATEPHPLVSHAADTVQTAYERMRIAQVETKTVGWARLPESSIGYMPHMLAAGRVKEMTPEQLRAFSDVLAKQFQEIEGMDAKFAEELARTYLNHARVNAFGGHEIPANIHNPAAADMVRGALEAMKMSKEEVAAMMGRYAAGGASHTKKRLHLDLNQAFPQADGSMGTLMDLFNTDHLGMLQNYADRVSGEVALANYGVMGSQGLSLIRTALMYGPKDANHVQALKAFDQISAEFLGRPFGDAKSKAVGRLMSVTAMVKLGGMGIPQFGESFNGVWAVGVKNTLESIVDMPRLIGEVHAIARGEKIENGVLGSMEQFGGGAEFGLDGYMNSSIHINPESAYNSYGHESATWIDRALRTGAEAASVLSMHRAIHAAQVRGMAEQITMKALRFIREGQSDTALRDMGFSEQMQAAFKADLHKAVEYDGAGRVKSFDITKISDIDAANEFVQSVHRGANQIIQGSFIGEKGHWVHSDMGRLLSQFRNYPLVAMEKQWARNKGNHGVAGALGILAGSMAFAMPVVLARIAFSAQGRADKDEYLAKQLDPLNLARASLNYVGSSGFAGEVMDMLSGAAGVETGGRKGSGSVVSSALPAAGYIEDVAKAVHDPTDPYKVARALPFSRTPVFLIGVNALKD